MTEDVKKNSASNNDAENTEEKGRAKDEKLDEVEKAAKKQEDKQDKKADATEEDSLLEDCESGENEDTDDATDESIEDSNDDEEAVATSDENDEEVKDDESEKVDDGKPTDTIEIEIKGSKVNHEEFQAEVREQIENCKFEIIASLQDKIHDELQHFEKQARRLERRRRSGVIVRDIIILILAAMVGFLAYCLYDAEYFEFLKPKCKQENNCEVTVQQKDPEVKSPEWYKQNYSYLFESLQTKLDADKVNAYYMYTDDRKVSEVQPEYLLAMAYNRLNSSTTYDSNEGIVVPANDLRQAYIDLVGNTNGFVKTSFDYHCANFQYRKESDDFMAKSLLCADTSDRKILEEIDEIYEEGNALYILTTATIYDKTNSSFYNFDNLFKPAVKNVGEDDFAKNKSSLNQYQYQFKKTDNKYYFSGVIKLK